MNANFMTKKIEMTKTEAKAAGKIGTEEFKLYRQYMEMYPGFEIQVKTTTKRKVEFKGLDYDYMRAYIEKHDDDKKSKMTKFETLIAQNKKNGDEDSEHLKAANYSKVRKWFIDEFKIKDKKRKHDEEIQAILNKVA